MGFFSWKCSKSDKSIPAFPYAGFYSEYSEVVLVTPENEKIEGFYDGYGRIKTKKGTVDILSKVGINQVKLVRKDYYNNETYEVLSLSEDCEYQGYFYPDCINDDYFKKR